MSVDGWERLLKISESDIRGASEDTIDELYAFLLTNKLQDSAVVGTHPDQLKKLLATVQTVLRLKDAEFQEIFTAYEHQQQKLSSDGGAATENMKLEQLLHQQEIRIRELESQSHGYSGGGREVHVLRQEVDDLRIQLSETKQHLDAEKMESEKLTRDLSSEHQHNQELQVELNRQREEVAGYRKKLTSHQERGGRSSGMGLVEEELRERLRVQEREMAEQLDRMEEMLSDRQRLEQQITHVTEQLGRVEEERITMNNEIKKHQDVLSQTDHHYRQLQNEMKRAESQIAHFQDQLTQQAEANSQLSDMIQQEREQYKTQLSSCNEELTHYKEKVTQLETQLRLLLQDTSKSSVLKLTKGLSEKQSQIDDLQTDLSRASDEIDSLNKQLEDANRRADPHKVSPALYQEINTLQSKQRELERLLEMEQQRRAHVEQEKEECDHELVEVRGRIEHYESGHIGLREAVNEIKQRKQEVTQRDSEISELIQRVNKLQNQVDTLYELNEALRLRLGMSPEDNPDLQEVREKREKEVTSLREHNQSLLHEVERLEDEKLTLRKRLVEQATSRPFETSSRSHEVSDVRSEIQSSQQPDHLIIAELRGQISHLQSLLFTERQRKESCQREIGRLSKEVLSSGRKMKFVKQDSETSPTRTKPTKEQFSTEETDSGADLQQKLTSLTEQQKLIIQTLKQKENEVLSLQKALKQSGVSSDIVSSHITPQYMSSPKRNKHVISTLQSSPDHTTIGYPDDDHLLLVLRELQEREHTLKDTQEQLEQYRRKFSVIIHQQGILYKEYQDAKIGWEEEKQKMTEGMEEMKILKEQDKVKTEELQNLHEALSSDPNSTRQKLGEMSRRLTVLRVDQRSLSRHHTLLQTSEAGLRKEVSSLKQSLNDIQISVTQQLTYLQRYKDAASYKISSLQNQLSESVPIKELEEARRQFVEVSSRHHALITQQTTAQCEVDTRVEELSLALAESRAREDELRMKLANSIDSQVQSQLETHINNLEKSLAKLKQDNSFSKEKYELIENQLELSQEKKDDKEKEIEALKQQIVELSSENDHKTIIGQLQQQLLIVKRSEDRVVRQLQVAQSKHLEVEIQLLKTQQQCGEKEDEIHRMKMQYISRIQRLNGLLQTLHRKYSGTTTLPDQEKFSSLLSQAKQDREAAQKELQELKKEREKVDDKVLELEIQQRNLQELITTLKDDSGTAAKITEWHSKLGEMRLKEFQQQRTITRLQEQVRHLHEVVSSCERNSVTMEQRLVQSTKEYEELLLSWEERENELKMKVDQLSSQDGIMKLESNKDEEEKVKINREDKSKGVHIESSTHSRKIAHLETEISRYQAQCQELHFALKRAEDLSSQLDTSLRIAKDDLMDKDKKIYELEHSVSVMEKRLTSEGNEREGHTERAIEIATHTIEQIQAQLTHKEGQLERYQRLLQENRKEHYHSEEKHRQEIDSLSRELETKTNALTRLQQFKLRDTSNDDRIIKQQLLMKLTQLEDVIKELESSNNNLTQQLTDLKERWEGEKREFSSREEEMKKERCHLKHKHNLEIKELQGALSVKSDRVTELEEELDIIKGELSAALDSAKKTPSRNLRGLVERLRGQLVEKEGQLETLRESLRQVRSDLVDTAQKTLQSHTRQEIVEANVHHLVSEKVKAMEEKQEIRIREVTRQLEEKKDLLRIKEKEIDQRFKELEISRNECVNMKKTLRDAEERERKLTKEISKIQANSHSSTLELEELHHRCSILQSRVEKQAQQLKQQQQEIVKEKSHSISEATSLIDTKHSSLEVARWEENKKWQHKVETLRAKLSGKNKELEATQKHITTLRETIERSEREKSLLQDQIRSLEKSRTQTIPTSSVVPSRDNWVSPDEAFALKSQIFKLNNEIASLKKQVQEVRTSKLLQLQAQNDMLNEMNKALQHEIKNTSNETSDTQGLLAHGTALRQDLLETKKQYTQLQFQYEQVMMELPRLRSRIDDLQQYIYILKNASTTMSNTRTDQIDKPGIYTAGEVEKVVSAMKKVIERLQKENESFKRSIKKQQRGLVEAENTRLKAEVEKLRKTLAALGGPEIDGKPSHFKVITENDRLRAELKMETERSEKQLANSTRYRLEKTKLEEELTKLKAELQAFDPQFFEEIEDLKYNYQEAIRKNVEYEEHLRTLSHQYGFPLPEINQEQGSG